MIHVNEGDLLVLPGKIRVPSLAAAILPRPRLTAMIEEAVSTARVTLVSGPAGAGKTVACQVWAAATSSRAVAWLTLDEADRQPPMFWASVQAALDAATASLVPAPRATSRAGRAAAGRAAAATRSGVRGGAATGPARAPAAGLSGGGDPAGSEPRGGLGARTVAAIGQPAAPVTLVIDDVHELAGSPAERELAFLLQRAPEGLGILLCGRFAPSAGLARLRLAGELTEVTAADLACTPRETRALAGPRLTPDERDRLHERTRGWLAGVLLSLREEGADAYLREQVLGGLSPGRQRFALHASVAPWLRPALAALLSGDGQAASVLDELAGHNCLVEVAGTRYRFHPMLRQMLRGELERRFPEQVPLLLARAARWYAVRGEALAAAGCLAEAGDWDGVAASLDEAGLAGALTGDLAALETLLRGYPGDPGWSTATPVIAAILAAARLAAGDREGAAACLAPARRDDLSAAAAAVMLAASQTGAATRTTPAANETGTGDAVTLAEAADPRTVAQRRARGVSWYAIGGAQLRAGRLTGARRALDRAAADLGGLALGERARGWLAVCLALSGDLRGADSVLAGLPVDGRAATASLARLASAVVALERDDLRTARATAADVAADGPAIPGEPDIAALALSVTENAEAGAQARPAVPTAEAGAEPDPERPGPGDDPTVREQIAALLAAAVTGRRRGRHAAAAQQLEEALALAEPHGAIRVFLEGGPAAHAAISILVAPRSRGAPFAARILERFAIHVPGESGLPERTAQLTESELAVLRLLPSQLTYREIAGEMFLSVNTVKTHLRLAYRKLGVNSRRAAVAQARRLGLV